MLKRAFGWWFLAEDICGQLTMPRADLDMADRQFERLLLESSLWSFGDRIARKVRAGWLDSAFRSVAHTLTRDGASLQPRAGASSDPVLAWQVVGFVTAIGAVTTLGAQALVAGRFEPLSWALPVAVAIGAVVLSRIAVRIRAAGHKTS
jgi:hypothetical protein